jgi:hypothetical protein
VVSLPGIDIPTWLRKPPPRDRGLAAVAGVVVGLLVAVFGALTTGNYAWAIAGVAIMLLSGYRAWTESKRHVAEAAAWIESIRRRS